MLLSSCLEPLVISQVFWKQKKAFQLAEDRYEEWVLFAVTEGRFQYRIGEAEGVAGFGDLVICPPFMLFEREVLEPLSFHFYRFDWSTAPESQLPVVIPLMDRSRLASNYHYLERLSAQPADDVKLARMGHILKDLWQMAMIEADQVRTKHRSLIETDACIEAAARKISEKAFGRVVLKQLSEELGQSPVQFTRRFQAVYGQTPMDYLTSLRLHKAQTLLLETELTLEQIAEQCGYENGFYFSRMFNKKIKVSPSAYRKSHRI
ncbi:helix-turn-helix domain-containing protein [Paenibacillus sp. LMG 31456]|uniref:Helix-turn-helix domain-containing protein n=1 Tax=Paenibacillus foliorum TaxID=2654974 RepID=A0A972GV55_9BACL|nr:AraC family transcriptional regulator [Paenibacillus foliorum]NOU94788.1 helix-turn-helix domain-containing protein [Paenibacillus foliorum]